MRLGLMAVALAGALLVPANANAATKRCGVSPNGTGVMANEHTSCQFARATARMIVKSPAPRVVRPYSKALGRRISMRRTGCGCSSFRPFVYRGGNDAAVWLQS